MRILINHLTRMRFPFVCVAGLREDGRHVRPVLECEQLGRDLLRSEDGPFSLGSVVVLGPTHSRPVVPEVEDAVFHPENVKPDSTLGSVKFGEVVKGFAKSSLGEIFGEDLVRLSGTAAAVRRDTGTASLGMLRVTGGSRLQSGVDPWGNPEIRCAISDPNLGELSLKVNDLRLWGKDHSTPALSEIEAIASRLQDCVVAVGLTRYYAVRSYPDEFGHWLQVNNIFPIDDPLWTRE